MIRYGRDEQGRPRIVLPEAVATYRKFVQLYINDEPYFRVKEEIDDYNVHATILERTLKEFRLNFDMFKREGHAPIPIPKGKDYECVGMGDVLVHNDLIEIGGESLGYKEVLGITLKLNREHLIELLPFFPEDKIIELNGEILRR